MARKRIALIFHEHERRRDLPYFAVWNLAEIWRNQGMEVIALFGTGKFIPADLAILHVDLTVVPQEYIKFARQYPIALNAGLENIRKSLISTNKVHPGDGYEGPVIVKSELNYAGQPEQKLLGTAWSRLRFRLGSRLPFRRTAGMLPGPHFRSPTDYIILESPRAVPKDWFQRDDLFIEKFIPEIQDGLYCVRVYHFLGNRGVCLIRKSSRPVVNTSTVITRERVEVHPEILRLTKSLGFDFGKFDYVMHEDRPVLLDANKTPGAGNTPSFRALCPEWARGIEAYL